jgi:hypothetical protein
MRGFRVFYVHRQRESNMTTAFDVIGWMTRHGYPQYATQINNLQAEIWETKAETGRYWRYCDLTRRRIQLINKEIAEIIERATDRYEDWASD